MDSLTLYNTPALPPPLGTESNFDNPESIVPIIQFTLGFCIAITSILVLLRIYSKVFIIKQHGWEDYTMVLAWLGFIGYTALGFILTNYGAGKHQWDIRVPDFIQCVQITNILDVCYNPLIFITKLSILLQYYSLFVSAKSGIYYWTIHALVWVNLLFYIAVMLVQIMSCLPREKIWNLAIDGRCVDLNAVINSSAVINVVSDFAILIVPLAKVWQLQLPRNRKLGLSAVFAVGLFACVSSLLRLVNNIKFADTLDVTYEQIPVGLWMVGEITSGIICGCLPALPALFRHSVPKLKRYMGSSAKYGRSWQHSAGTEQRSRPRQWSGETRYLELEEGRSSAKGEMGLRTALASEPEKWYESERDLGERDGLVIYKITEFKVTDYV